MKKGKKIYRHKYGGRNLRCLVPFETIEAAVYGDENAINAIVEHYGSYILRLAGKTAYTDDGRNYYVVDKNKEDILKNGLMEKIPRFNY